MSGHNAAPLLSGGSRAERWTDLTGPKPALAIKGTHGVVFVGPTGCLFLAAKSTSAEDKTGDTTNGLLTCRI